jgi:hypothetical protein
MPDPRSLQNSKFGLISRKAAKTRRSCKPRINSGEKPFSDPPAFPQDDGLDRRFASLPSVRPRPGTDLVRQSELFLYFLLRV